ncbi:hypothetical protein BN10_690008 [Phycicoccus elongatus Lp2]|uniref:Uncharacterized protein n=1 Tax=Phycicoccus elongatus Lp2 TaxID=1193181 RepID=N0E606_9MICO|nr:hypothetical protein BN10_690008 [Phycicoccus elongatus Lp2]
MSQTFDPTYDAPTTLDDQLRRWRRTLHQHPETAFTEHATAQRIARAASSPPTQWRRSTSWIRPDLDERDQPRSHDAGHPRRWGVTGRHYYDDPFQPQPYDHVTRTMQLLATTC